MISVVFPADVFWYTVKFPGRCGPLNRTVKHNKQLLTMQAEGDVDGPLLNKALEIGDLSTFQDGLRGTVTNVDPADCVFCIVEVHGSGLLGAGGSNIGDGPTIQVRSHYVLRVGNE